MHDFLLKELNTYNIENELKKIGFDSSYTFYAKNKFYYKNFKIFNLSCAQANIIKQLALSVGADCGTNKDVITGKIERSDCVLGGSVSQLLKIAKKMQLQPFGLKQLGLLLEEQVSHGKNFKTKIMGILNVTLDSFSDGGKYYKYENAINHLNKLINDGADIIDIGAETTKPGAKATEPEKQIDRLLPILNYIKESNINIPISIDTRSSKVASTCIETGVVSIINDVSGLDYDSQMAGVIATYPNVKIVIQHSLGTPDIMQINPHYENLMDEIFVNLYNKLQYAQEKGISKENIIVDPGIGFGKTCEDNFEIINRWQEFRSLGCPVLLGLSRKSLLGLPEISNEEKDIYSLALNSILIHQNIDYVRVHNVKYTKTILNMLNKEN